MGQLYWQTQKLYDGETASFDFSGVSDSIYGYLAGIAGFQLAFGAYHHRVREAGIVLDANRYGEKLIQVTARLHLDSDAGDRRSPDESWVFVTVVISTAGDDSVLVDGAPKVPATLPTNIDDFATLDAALSAFWFDFGHDQGHRLSSIEASLDASPSHGVAVDGSGALHGDTAESATVELGAAVIASSTDEEIPFETQVATVDEGATDFGRSNTPARATFDSRVAAATALLASFDIAFGEDSVSRDLSCLKGGAMTYDTGSGEYLHVTPQIHGREVVVTTNLSMMRDHSAGHQSSSNQAIFLVIASPHADSEISAPTSAGQVAEIP